MDCLRGRHRPLPPPSSLSTEAEKSRLTVDVNEDLTCLTGWGGFPPAVPATVGTPVRVLWPRARWGPRPPDLWASKLSLAHPQTEGEMPLPEIAPIPGEDVLRALREHLRDIRAPGKRACHGKAPTMLQQQCGARLPASIRCLGSRGPRPERPQAEPTESTRTSACTRSPPPSTRRGCS